MIPPPPPPPKKFFKNFWDLEKEHQEVGGGCAFSCAKLMVIYVLKRARHPILLLTNEGASSIIIVQ